MLIYNGGAICSGVSHKVHRISETAKEFLEIKSDLRKQLIEDSDQGKAKLSKYKHKAAPGRPAVGENELDANNVRLPKISEHCSLEYQPATIAAVGVILTI